MHIARAMCIALLHILLVICNKAVHIVSYSIEKEELNEE